jgi:hypothetical protein
MRLAWFSVLLWMSITWVQADNEPVMSGGKTIQFTGDIPAPSQRSQHVRYDLDLKQEHFAVYAPAAYDGHERWGLVVYISPDDQQEGPPGGWEQVLGDAKLLFICPQQDGNDQPGNRREGLAVIAALEVEKFYSIDPARVYIAGFSGGARTASGVAFHQSDIFHATIQCCGSDFYKAVPKVAVTDSDLQKNPGTYGLLDADPQEVANAKKSVKFVLTTGSEDFREHYIHDIYDGGFQAEGFNSTLLDVHGTGHEPCLASTLRKAIDFIEQSP